jgi:hypothetical protein
VMTIGPVASNRRNSRGSTHVTHVPPPGHDKGDWFQSRENFQVLVILRAYLKSRGMGASPMQFAAQRLFGVSAGERLVAANPWARRPCHVKSRFLDTLSG